MIVYNANEFIEKFQNKFKKCETVKIYHGKDEEGNPKYETYLRLYCGFDIETTSVSESENAYMYHWQFGLNGSNLTQTVIIGRKWSTFLEFMQTLKSIYDISEERKVIIWVANLGYEFQFMRKQLTKIAPITRLFAKENRRPLVVSWNGFEFREALTISGGNLNHLAKTYCFTKKMIGDLDYNIIRNSSTTLTDKELQYCYNDVIILSEWSNYIFNNYIQHGGHYVPVTSTQIIRKELKQNWNLYYREKNKVCKKHTCENLYPRTKEGYNFIMKFLFRGGLVHGNIYLVMQTLFNIFSADRKSSYPASALEGNYPIAPFVEAKPEGRTKESLFKTMENCCFWGIFEFENIKASTNHSIESLSKVMEISEKVIDNGRVRKAGKLLVALNENDFLNYCDFYKWEKMTVKRIFISPKGRLPKYILDLFYKYYELKKTIDKEAEPLAYAISKQKLNGIFGMTCTRFVFDDVVYDNDDWQECKPIDKTYEEMLKGSIMSPYWGIWISSISRREECKLLKMLEDTSNESVVAYYDTDSHKFKGTKAAFEAVEKYNAENEEKVLEACRIFNYDYNILKGIGSFEIENERDAEGKPIAYKRFKTLGAKRYIYEDSKGIHVTVSGLPEGALQRYAEAEKKDAFELFDNKMCIPKDFTNKLVSIYNDEKASDILEDLEGNIERMEEESNLFLKPSDFNLKMSQDFIEYLGELIERFKKGIIT